MELEEVAHEAAASDGANQSRCLAVLTVASNNIFQTKWPIQNQGKSPIRENIARSISFALESVIQANDPPNRPSAFDSPDDADPSVGIGAYIDRFSEFSPVGDEALITTVILIDRFMAFESPRGFALNGTNVHRLWASAFVVCQKWLEDRGCSNGFYSRIAGVSVQELNSLERAFLRGIRFSASVSFSEFDSYATPVIAMALVLGSSQDLSFFHLP